MRILGRQDAAAEWHGALAAAKVREAALLIDLKAAEARAEAAEAQSLLDRAAKAAAEQELTSRRAKAGAEAKKTLKEDHRAQLEALKSAHAQRLYQAVRIYGASNRFDRTRRPEHRLNSCLRA